MDTTHAEATTMTESLADRIRALVERCRQEAIAADRDSGEHDLEDWEPTAEDLHYVTAELGFKPTRAQWDEAIGSEFMVFSGHCGDGDGEDQD